MKAETPTAEDLKQWDALGGKQVMEKKRAVFIAPSGKRIYTELHSIILALRRELPWDLHVGMTLSDHAGDKLKSWSEAALIISQQKSEAVKGEIQKSETARLSP